MKYFVGFVLFSSPAWAAESAPEMGLLTTFVALIFVVALILVLALLLKKMRLPALGNQQGLAILRQIQVGAKERIVVVKAGEEQFLVGVTSHSIQLISKLEQPIDQTSDDDVSSFANQFSRLLKKNEKN